MPKVLLVGDTHVYRHKQITSRQEDCLKCLTWAVDTARKNKIKNVIHLGDVFHDKIRIHTLLYQQVFQILQDAQDLKFTLLLGNHDMWFMDRRDVSSIMPFGALPNVEVVSSPKTMSYDGYMVDFVPYSIDPVSKIAQFKNKSRVMMGHLAVDNALLNIVKKTRSEVEIESDADMIAVTTNFFKGWERVFLGHYHGAQVIDGFVEYVGSNLQLTWNEVNQEKHLVVLDLETLDRQYVINDFSPRHLIVSPQEALDSDLSKNFVRVEVESIDKSDIISLKAEILSRYQDRPGPLEIDFIEKNKKNLEETASPEQQNKFKIATGDTIKRFVEATGAGELEKDLLEEIGQNIVAGEL